MSFRLPGALRALVVVAALVAALAGCSPDTAPPLPADATAAYQKLTAGDGTNFLDSISSYEWQDDGAAAATALAWIASDAAASDPDAAARAGQAAHAIATYLSDHESMLVGGAPDIGQRNPALVRGYAAALAPFQGAMLGYPAGVRGFDPLATNGRYSAVRNVFAAIDTDTQAGTDFTRAAYDKVDEYLHQYAAAATGPGAPASTGLAASAYLSGVVEGGAEAAKNNDVLRRTVVESRDLAAYTVAAQMHPSPGIISSEFFDREGLKAPNHVPERDLQSYSDQLRQFLNQNVTVGQAFVDYYQQYQSALSGG